MTRRQIIDEIVEQAEAVDAAEALEFGVDVGTSFPIDGWVDRRARLREALRQFDADGPSDSESYQASRKAREAEMGRKLGGRPANPDSKWVSPARTRRINVTAEVTIVARDSVVFETTVVATEENLADTGADRVETFVLPPAVRITDRTRSRPGITRVM